MLQFSIVKRVQGVEIYVHPQSLPHYVLIRSQSFCIIKVVRGSLILYVTRSHSLLLYDIYLSLLCSLVF